MSSIRAIRDTNEEIVYPQTIANAVSDKNGVTLQHILDSLVHVGEKRNYEDFGDIAMSLNPSIMDSMNIGETKINFSEVTELNDITTGDKTKDIVGKLQLAIKEISTLKNNMCNPNLLINSNFSNPVNQRGQSEYIASTSDDLFPSIDCWTLLMRDSEGTNAYLKVTLNDNSTTFSLNDNTNNSFGYLHQSIENPNNYNSTEFTASVRYRMTQGEGFLYYYYELDDGVRNLYSKPLIVDGEWHTTSMTYTLDFSSKITKLYPMAIKLGGENNFSKSEIELVSAKFEKSKFATRHYKKPYAEELRACQRYFYRLKSIDVQNYYHIHASLGTSNILPVIIDLPVIMCKPPTFSSSILPESVDDPNAIVAWSSTTANQRVSKIEALSRDPHHFVLHMTVDYGDKTLPDVPYIIILKGDAYIDINAEIV